jgi:hypothetical protein
MNDLDKDKFFCSDDLMNTIKKGIVWPPKEEEVSKFNVYKNAVVMPYNPPKQFNNSSDYLKSATGGVLDENGNFIENSKTTTCFGKVGGGVYSY